MINIYKLQAIQFEKYLNGCLRKMFINDNIELTHLPNISATHSDVIKIITTTGNTPKDVYNWLCNLYDIKNYGLCTIRYTQNKLISISRVEAKNEHVRGYYIVKSHIYDVQ